MKLRTEQIASVGLAIAIVCLFLFVVHLPQKRSFNELEDQIEAREEQLHQARQKSSTLLLLDKRVEALRSAVAKFNKRLPNRSELSNCLKQIVASLKSAQLVSQEIRPNSPTSMPRYSELPVTMTFRGTFGNISMFLDKIEKMNHLTRVKELKLESNQKGESEIRATVVLSIYCNRS